MRSTRNVLPFAAAFGVALTLFPTLPQQVAAQTEINVLVAPVTVSEGIDRRFGERIADEIRKSLERFPGYRPISKGDVEKALKQYSLDANAMTPIEWRQLATAMSAPLVMTGTASRGGGGVEVNVTFQDPRTGDALPTSAFSVADDRQHERAAQTIMTQLETGVEYGRRIAFCADYLASEQVQDAINNCNEALEYSPESTRARYLRGRAHMLAESWGTAAEDLESVVAADPSNTEALQSLAYTHAKLGNKDRSLELYREYLNFNPEDVDVRLNIAYELASAGGFAEAMAILQDGVARDPDNIPLLEYLGGVALSAGQSGGQVTDPAAIRTSVDAFEKVMAAKGDNLDPAMLTNVVNAYLLIEEYDDALAFSERALQMIENPPAASGESQNGEEPQTPAMSKEQLLAQVHAARANVFSRTDRYAQAADEFGKALRYNPDIENGHQRLAQFKLRAGDSQGAIADFRTAVTQGADSNQIADALFAQGYQDHFQKKQYRPAIDMFEVAAEFARAPDVSNRIHFFAAYGYYLQGTAIDNSNAQAEACAPARNALSTFQAALPHLNRAGNYEANSQGEIRNAVDVQVYRQEQIIKKSC